MIIRLLLALVLAVPVMAQQTIDINSGTRNTLLPSRGGFGTSLTFSKGDILCALASGNLDRLPAGSNTQVLTLDSTQTCGVKWASTASTTYTATLPVVVTGTVISINNFGGDSGSGGTAGAVPAPASGDSAAGKFLAAGGGWSVPPGTSQQPCRYIFYVSGGTVFAQNCATGAIDFSGSDATVVCASAMNAAKSQCGRLYFKNGVYNFNTLTHETQSLSGVTTLPYYAFGTPSDTGVTNQQCTWDIVGEQMPFWMGEFTTAPIETSGVIFKVTSAALATVGGSDLVASIWAKPNASGVGNYLYVSNLAVRFPSNQRGNEIGIYAAGANAVDFRNVTADFDVAYPTLTAGPAPVAGTIGSVGMTSTLSNNGNWQHFENTYAVGYDTAYSFMSEHLSGTNVTAYLSNYACKFGDAFNGNTYTFAHGGSLIHFSDQENINGCVFGSKMGQGSLVDLPNLTFETVPPATPQFSPVWNRVNNMTETNAGYTSGIITYERGVPYTGLVNLPANQLFTTGGNHFQINDSQAVGGFANSNCTSTASPAACVSALVGTVRVAAGATSLVVNTNSITATSTCQFTYDTTGLTAPTNMTSLVLPYVSARTAGTSFTMTLPVAPATNPVNVQFACTN